MSVEVRSQTGDVVGEVELDARIFGAQVNVPLMHQVVRAQLAAARAGTHAAKTRGDVSGGGKKPWRQKGTGRARQGSTRAPHWMGGGVAMGPKPRDHSVAVPKKMRVGALYSALSDRANLGAVHVVDSLVFESPKTQEAVKVLESFELKGNVLLVLDTPDMTIGKSFRNLPHVRVTLVSQLNTYDVLDSDSLLFTRAALEAVSLSASKATAKKAASTPMAAEITASDHISDATNDEVPSSTSLAVETDVVPEASAPDVEGGDSPV
jgi:large subunit ribosomal protein L4